MPNYQTIADLVGNTPLIQIKNLATDQNNNTILAKLEGNNPAGSVKDRPAFNMIAQAEKDGIIKPGDTLIEATSGNTGIALAMVAAIKGYKMVLIMPDNMSMERRGSMAAFGAELVLVSKNGGMEAARDLADKMQADGKGLVIDQFANANNPAAHIVGTGPEIWRDTEGEVTHFVSAMGTTGTITGVSQYLKSQNPEIEIVGVQPDDDSQIPGIRKWPEEYLPKIFKPENVDRVLEMRQAEAEATTLKLAKQEGIFCGISSGGAVAAALRISQEVQNATIVTIICDRGDRYLSTGLFS
jgi:S-sulfo-L-cysteine synthase (O-acetyl-L-serine-dependent)